jgi:hypothetical protein
MHSDDRPVAVLEAVDFERPQERIDEPEVGDTGINFSGTVEQNDLVGNTLCGLHNNATVGLQVPNNFWGAATGPGPAPANPFCNDSGASTNDLPFATKAFNVKTRFKP